jgi:hypothetical protein
MVQRFGVLEGEVAQINAQVTQFATDKAAKAVAKKEAAAARQVAAAAEAET